MVFSILEKQFKLYFNFTRIFFPFAKHIFLSCTSSHGRCRKELLVSLTDCYSFCFSILSPAVCRVKVPLYSASTLRASGRPWRGGLQAVCLCQWKWSFWQCGHMLFSSLRVLPILWWKCQVLGTLLSVFVSQVSHCIKLADHCHVITLISISQFRLLSFFCPNLSFCNPLWEHVLLSLEHFFSI